MELGSTETVRLLGDIFMVPGLPLGDLALSTSLRGLGSALPGDQTILQLRFRGKVS